MGTRVKTHVVREMFFGEGEDRFAEYAQKGKLKDHLEKGGWNEAAKEKRAAAHIQPQAEGNAARRHSQSRGAKVKAKARPSPKGEATDGSTNMVKRTSVRNSAGKKADPQGDERRLRKGASKMIKEKPKEPKSKPVK